MLHVCVNVPSAGSPSSLTVASSEVVVLAGQATPAFAPASTVGAALAAVLTSMTTVSVVVSAPSSASNCST